MIEPQNLGLVVQVGSSCAGEHRFFVPEVIAIPEEGQVFIPIVCTACGLFRERCITVGPKGSQIRLLKEEHKDKS